MNEISWAFHGNTKGYHIYLNGEQVHFTQNEYERDMFIAELKARIRIIEEKIREAEKPYA